MFQAVLEKPKTIVFREVAVPEPGKDEVLIKVSRIGICGSDIHVYHGKHKYATLPVVQGHEGSGTIAKVGAGVTNFTVGEQVTIRPQLFCGECIMCQKGRNNLCLDYKVIGVLGSTIGMASEYFLIKASLVHKLPKGMTLDQGAMVEPAAVAVHSVKLGAAPAGNNTLVVGAGPIGNLVAQAAKALGAGKVVLVDISQQRLELAKQCGIDVCVNSKDRNLADIIEEQFGSNGADVIIDCAGAVPLMEQMVQAARRGTNIVLTGNYYDKVPVELGLVQRREINLVGVMNYVAEDYEDTIRFIASGAIKLELLMSKYFDIKEYSEAYQYIDENMAQVMKVLLKVGD
ncbi:MAG: Threonine dehydrogenase and related Zn-dependent dehydrogenase [Firmicutes bacterium]|nr:Threonine dehydrogenase and related Zn-dependent dehydrogenase [Bacillota bacterium]